MPSDDRKNLFITAAFLCGVVSLLALIRELRADNVWGVAVSAIVIGWTGHILYGVWRGA